MMKHSQSATSIKKDPFVRLFGAPLDSHTVQITFFAMLSLPLIPD